MFTESLSALFVWWSPFLEDAAQKNWGWSLPSFGDFHPFGFFQPCPLQASWEKMLALRTADEALIKVYLYVNTNTYINDRLSKPTMKDLCWLHQVLHLPLIFCSGGIWKYRVAVPKTSLFRCFTPYRYIIW